MPVNTEIQNEYQEHITYDIDAYQEFVRKIEELKNVLNDLLNEINREPINACTNI